MTKEEFETLQNNDDVLVIDIREPEELEAVPTVEGATNIPMGKVFTEAFKGNIPKDKKIVSVCMTGGRCRVLSKHLNERGFDADFLEGGLKELRAEV